MDSPQHTGDRVRVETGGVSERNGTKNAQIGLLANKVKAIIFLGTLGIIHIGYFQMGSTINDECYERKKPLHYAAYVLKHYSEI